MSKQWLVALVGPVLIGLVLVVGLSPLLFTPARPPHDDGHSDFIPVPPDFRPPDGTAPAPKAGPDDPNKFGGALRVD